MKTLLVLALAPLAVGAGHSLLLLVQDLSLAAQALAVAGGISTLVVAVSGPEDERAKA